MRGRGKKSANWVSNNIVGIIALFLQMIQILQVSLSGKELPSKLFCVILNSVIIICFYKLIITAMAIVKEYKKYKSYIKEKRDEVERYGDTLKYNYAYCLEKAKDKFLGKCLFLFVKKCNISFLIYIGTAILICWGNPKNALAYWEGIEKIFGIPTEEVSVPDEVNVKEIDVGLPMEEEEPVREIRDMNWRFIIDEPTGACKLDDHLKEQVFFEADKSEEEWADYVRDTVKQWRGQKESVDYTAIKDENENNFYTYTHMEDAFKAEVKKASEYIYFEDWQEKAPHSSKYDECIAGREKLNRIEAEGKAGCYELLWKLANDYLYYAQEYEKQTTNAEAVLYYYTKSIDCCMEALKYSVSEEEYNRTYHFMVMRYHDLYRDECIVSKEYKVRANNIFILLSETDVLKNVY